MKIESIFIIRDADKSGMGVYRENVIFIFGGGQNALVMSV
jgi:hypothetical protein